METASAPNAVLEIARWHQAQSWQYAYMMAECEKDDDAREGYSRLSEMHQRFATILCESENL
jgi:hypothetical protein